MDRIGDAAEEAEAGAFRQRRVLVQPPPIPPGESRGSPGASGYATVPPGDPSTDSDAITRGPLGGDDVIEVVEGRGEGAAKVIASMPGPAVSVSQVTRSASRFNSLGGLLWRAASLCAARLPRSR